MPLGKPCVMDPLFGLLEVRKLQPTRSDPRPLTEGTPNMSRIFITSLALLGLLSACGGGADKGGADAEAIAEANKIWNERCVTCHGADGGGTGPGAAALVVKPRSFKDPAWQSSVDDARIKKVIVEGGASVGLNEAMAPNPDLKDKPAVQDALTKKIRKLVQ